MLRRRFLVLSSIAIIAFWLVMMGLLLRREVFTPHWNAGSGATVSQTSDIWLGLLLNDKANTSIGFINLHTDPVPRGKTAGIETRIVGRMRLNLGEYNADLSLTGLVWATAHAGLRDFEFSVRSGEHATSVKGRVEGGRVRGEIQSGGETLPLDLPVDSSMAFSGAPGMGSLTMPDIAVGQEVLVDTFDPLTMSMGKARVRCEGVETIRISGKPVRTKVFTTNLSGITSKAWVDDSGSVMRAETPIGFVLQRMEASEAMTSTVAGPAPNEGLLRAAAITPAGQTPRRGAKRLTLHVTGYDGAITVPTDDSQVERGEGEFVIAPVGPVENALPLPGAERSAALANDSFLQIANPRIVDKARAIVGDETDPWKKANLIYEWVHTSIKKNIVPTLPTALDVLQTMEGDCNEHTMLFTALARSVDIPTRMAIGVVWSEDYHAFYYHAWPEVYAGRWVWMDPTLGQPIADATHFKLVNGDLAKWWQVAPFIGRLKVEIAAVE